MNTEPHWTAFYRELGVIGPRLLRGIDPGLLRYVVEEATMSDAFFSEGLERALSTNWSTPEDAVRAAAGEWVTNVRTYLEGLLRPTSAIPWDMTNVSIVAREQLRLSVESISADLESDDLLGLVAAAAFGLPRTALPISMLIQSIVEPVRHSDEGAIVRAVAVPWRLIVAELQRDWNAAYSIPSRKWEELVAAAFEKDGYDEVVLTPASADHGRDVIAVKHGVGTIKIVGSVKAYGPDKPVRYDDVRALIGVLHGDRSASKAIITTTSSFAPKLLEDPFIAPFVPYRLELLDGIALRRWLVSLTQPKK